MPVAGIWLPAWTNAVAWHRVQTWVIGQMVTNRDFAGALPRSGAVSQLRGPIRLTVIARWIPLVTAAYGTLVARRVTDTPGMR
jgi:hypothetical protein